VRALLVSCLQASTVRSCRDTWWLGAACANCSHADLRPAACAAPQASCKAAILIVTTMDIHTYLHKHLEAHANIFHLKKKLSTLGKLYWLKRWQIFGFIWVGWNMQQEFVPDFHLGSRFTRCTQDALLETERALNKQSQAAKTLFCCTKCRRLLFSTIKMTNHPLIKLWLINSSNFCLIMLIFRHVKQ